MGTEEAEASRLTGCNQRYVDSLLRSQVLSSAGQAVPAFFLSLGALILLLYGGHLVIKGQMTLGALVAFSAYQGRLITPIKSLMGLYLGIQRAGVSLERVFELLDQQPYVKEAIHPISLSAFGAKSNFEAFPSTMNLARRPCMISTFLCALAAGWRSLVLRAPERLPSWSYCCVSTTLSRGRFCWMGTICANCSSKPCARTSRSSLTSPVSSMPRLRRISDTETHMRQLRTSTRLRVLPTFTSSFCLFRKAIKRWWEKEGSGFPPDNDKGLPIARAILRKAKIWLFDEATATLDVLTESRIREAMDRWLGEHTSIIVTHRLSSVVDMDRIVVLERGRITQVGDHRQLLRMEGLINAHHSHVRQVSWRGQDNLRCERRDCLQ